MIAKEDIFSRSLLVLGEEAFGRLQEKRVIVFGVGGVGSWCAEGLVRSGVSHMTLVDSDVIAPSNINRQEQATTLTVGRSKVEVLRDRLLEINPSADIVALSVFYDEKSKGQFHLDEYDYIVDAIDSLQSKALLHVESCKTRAKLFASMGAALKMDPTRVEVAEFWKVKGCPLARSLRQYFKRTGVFPMRKYACVFSQERLKNQPVSNAEAANGSLVHITAVYGFTLSGLIIKDIFGGE